MVLARASAIAAVMGAMTSVFSAEESGTGLLPRELLPVRQGVAVAAIQERSHAPGKTLEPGGGLALVDDERGNPPGGVAPRLIPLPLPPVVRTYCWSCHGEDGNDIEGGFDLRRDLSRDRWQEAVHLLEVDEMPIKAPFPGPEEREALLAWLNRKAAAARPAPREPAPVVTRLSAPEFDGAMRALWGIDLRPSELVGPEATGESGFRGDRRSRHLDAALMEKYLAASERIVESMAALRRDPIETRFEAEAMERSSSHLQDFDEGVLFSVEAQMISTAMRIPVDGYYEVRIRASTIGLPAVAQLWDGDRVVDAVEVRHKRPGTRTYLMKPLLRRGWRTLSLNSRNLVPQASLPADPNIAFNQRAREHRMRVPSLEPGGDPAEYRNAKERLEDACFYLQQAFEWLGAYGTEGDPRDIVRFRDLADERQERLDRLKAEFVDRFHDDEREAFESKWAELNGERMAGYQEHLDRIRGIKWMDWTRFQGQLYVDSIEIRGPVWPADAPGARPWLANWNEADAFFPAFLADAFQRAPSDTELARYRELVRAFEAQGASKRKAFEQGVVAALVSPHVLTRDWSDPSARVSWFLRGEPPGDSAAFEPMNPDALAAAVREKRFIAQTSRFIHQWLGTDPLGSEFRPNLQRFPGFTDPVLDRTKEQPVRFFLRLLEENRPLAELLDSDWTVAHSELSAFGGLGSGGEQWEVKTLPSGSVRGGLLGMPAVLAATSKPLRTSPVFRGAWIWETLMGRHNGEPPPDAGILPPDAGVASGVTLRQELERHRNEPSCAGCHEKIDPLGFALENFDAIGRWRESMNGQEIDAQGSWHRGEAFEGPQGLKQALLARSNEFERQLAKQWLAFATGEPVRSLPPEVEKVVQHPPVRARDLLEAIVTDLASEAARVD